MEEMTTADGSRVHGPRLSAGNVADSPRHGGPASRRRSVRMAAGVLALVLAAFGGAVAGLDPPRDAQSVIPVWIVAHGWHAGLAVRASDVPATLWPERGDIERAQYFEVGWGDRAYWQADDPGLRLALEALLVPTPSVVRLIGIEVPPAATFAGAEVVEIGLMPGAFECLLRFVDQTFARTGAGRAAAISAPSPNIRFYPAHGSYHVFRTSNTWTARALRAAGVDITPAFALTPGSVVRHARRHGAGDGSDASMAGRRWSQ
jgi:uncharacterized protein (TIGR02117 family)